LTVRTLRAIFALLLVAALAAPPALARQMPSRTPPLRVDFDMEHIPEPAARRNSQFYDFFDATFFQQSKQAFDIPRYARPKPAANVNSVDEVPDSSWFTNRISRRPMTPEEIHRGPNTSAGPDTSGTWTIVAGKADGITPGFTVRDAAGVRYIIKFDPPDYPEMSSGAEVVSTKLYWASGYNTPENYITRFDPTILEISPQAMIADTSGRRRPMTREDLEIMMRTVPRLADGRVRAMASKFLSGKPKGPFRYYGLREDDPNDWIPHEQRRELRGLRLIAAWLHDNDIREQNTLDMYVTEDGRSFLRHYLIDFGSSLGSDTVHPNIDRVGFEYILDGAEAMKSLLSLGIYRRPWEGRRPVRFPSIGYIEAETFEPLRWKPNYPIVAFENMTAADAHWAAKIVTAFTDEHIRAAVSAGEYSDPEAAKYLARVLIERRDRIGRTWLARSGGLDEFSLAASGGETVLRFTDLAVARGYADAAARTYRYRVLQGRSKGGWRELDAADGLAIPLSSEDLQGQRIIEIQVRTDGNPHPAHWSPAVAVHVDEEAGEFHLLGWVRSER
jgi:hypothetical protein